MIKGQDLAKTITVDLETIKDTLNYVGEECRFDHHGYCQEHSLQEKEHCFVRKLKEAVARKMRGE